MSTLNSRNSTTNFEFQKTYPFREFEITQDRHGNSGLLYIDNSSNATIWNPVSNIVTNLSQSSSLILNNQCRRIGLTYFSFSNTIPTICNGRNSDFTINVAGTLFNIHMDDAYFSSNATLMAYVALNMTNQVPGHVFTATTVANSLDLKWTISIDVDTFFFVLDDNLKRLKWLFNPIHTQTQQVVKECGPVYRMYTRYFRIDSLELNRYARLKSAHTKFGNINSILLVDLKQYTDRNLPGEIFDIKIDNPRWINLPSDASFESISIRIIDEYGELLYIKNSEFEGATNPNNFFFNIKILMEL